MAMSSGYAEQVSVPASFRSRYLIVDTFILNFFTWQKRLDETVIQSEFDVNSELLNDSSSCFFKSKWKIR